MGRILGGNQLKLIWIRSFCSIKPYTTNSNNITSTSKNGSSSLKTYDEQYKALSNLDFMKAAKILFTDSPKKKEFGLDFHLVQLFFVCMPSLAVYLVAQYARSEMRKMDAELERKKQAEFEAHAKEMELKAAEEEAAVSSNPELLQVKERLDKIEDTVKQIVVEFQRTDVGKSSKGSTTAPDEGKSSEVAEVNQSTAANHKRDKDGGTSKEAK